MKQIFLQPVIAMFSAARLLVKSRRALVLILGAYAGLLTVLYLFVSTREATIPQLILTLVVVVAAPALFFVLQAASISYTNGPLSKQLLRICFKVTVVTVPVIGLTALGVYGLSKVDSLVLLATALRYLLIAVIAPLLAIQLWIATSNSARLLRNLRTIAMKAFAPQYVVVYVFGFLIFAVAPYLLITQKIPTDRAWLEFALLTLRLSTSALLILLGWVSTVGAISILSRGDYSSEN